MEGSDQHRGWFQSSLLLSSAINGVSPYKNLLTHGFTVDEKGEKMSKSKGNVVAPDKVIKQYGSEILRLWVALSDYQSDLKISDNILKQTSEQYRKIRNTFRFLLANVDDLDEIVSIEKYGELDRWILTKAKMVLNDVKESFDSYDFLRGLAILNHFITNELSGIYMDITKDRLYCDAKDSITRRATQSAMFLISRSMLALIAPILTYTADEILEYAPTLFRGDMESIFDLVYTELPIVKESFDDEKLLIARERFSEAVDRLKKEKIIKSTLELEIAGAVEQFDIGDDKDLEDWFVVSALKSHSKGEEIASFEIDDRVYTIHKATRSKCPRCWRFASIDEDSICPRCTEVVNV
jgi:isoleucyl-tRNA synthetase